MRKGQKQTDEAKMKISASNTGRIVSEGTKQKMSEAHKAIGSGKWMKGRSLPPEVIKKLSDAKKGKPFCGTRSDWNGKEHNPRSKIKMRMARLGKKLSLETRKRMSIAKQGPNSHFWRGGLTEKNYVIRHCFEYKEWRKSVFERDNYACQECGAHNHKGSGVTVVLQADHIKPFFLFPELRFDINNGRTLCVSCHRKTNTYGRRAIYYPRTEITIL